MIMNKLLFILIFLASLGYWIYRKRYIVKSIFETIKINPNLRRYLLRVLAFLLFRRIR